MSPLDQPTLPAEGAYTDLEQLFIAEQPKHLWPDNQNSNLGAIRKVVTGLLQGALTTLSELAQEQFVMTSKEAEYLGRHEVDMGLPVAPTGRSEAERRTLVLGRKQKGPFTKARRREIVESHITATFGAPTDFSPSGIPLDALGLTLHTEAGAVDDLYRIYEDVRNFTYEVWVKDTVSVDTVSLLRELNYITPSWMSFTVDGTKTNVLNYHRAVLNKQPVAYFRMNGVDATDESGYGNNGTFPAGNPAAVAGPGLLNAAVQHDLAGAGDGAADFPGGAIRLSVSDHVLYDGIRDISAEAWIRIDGFPAGADYGTIMLKSTSWQFRTGAPDGIAFYVYNPVTTLWFGRWVGGLSIGTTYHVVCVKRGLTLEIWVNGVRADTANIGTTPIPEILNVGTGALFIGSDSTGGFNGVIDEAAIYSRALSTEEIIDNYNTGRNVL